MVHNRKYPLFYHNLYLGVKVTQNVAQYLQHNMTYAPVSLKLLCPWLRRRSIYKNTLYDLDLWVKVTPNVVQCPPNQMTIAHAKFEIATTNSLGEDAFTRKYIIWHWPSRQGHAKCCPVSSTSCEQCHYRVWSYYIKSFRRRSIYQKIQYLTFDLDLGVKAHKLLPSTLYIMWSIQLQSLKFLGLTVYEEIHLQVNTLFDFWPWPWGQGHTKCCPVPSTSCELCTYRVWSCYVNMFRRRSIYKKFNIWPLTLTLGSRSHKMLLSTLIIMWPIQLQSLKLLRITV